MLLTKSQSQGMSKQNKTTSEQIFKIVLIYSLVYLLVNRQVFVVVVFYLNKHMSYFDLKFECGLIHTRVVYTHISIYVPTFSSTIMFTIEFFLVDLSNFMKITIFVIILMTNNNTAIMMMIKINDLHSLSQISNH